jgi:hypothetical protein
MAKAVALVIVAVLAGLGFHAFGQVRADVRPAITPIGNSSSNGMSFAWFYDSTERVVYVCRTGHGGGDTVDCRAKTSLP